MICFINLISESLMTTGIFLSFMDMEIIAEWNRMHLVMHLAYVDNFNDYYYNCLTMILQESLQ